MDDPRIIFKQNFIPGTNLDFGINFMSRKPVSYTHLDVYKRQGLLSSYLNKPAGVFLCPAGRAIFTFTDRLYHIFTKKAIGFDEIF